VKQLHWNVADVAEYWNKNYRAYACISISRHWRHRNHSMPTALPCPGQKSQYKNIIPEFTASTNKCSQYNTI